MRVPGRIAGVALSQDVHLWRWVIVDSAGMWSGYLSGIRLDAPLEEAGDQLADHVARCWDGQRLPGPWVATGVRSWRAGEPLPADVDGAADGWPQDPTFDWPSVFACGDVVRLCDGRLAVVSCVLDDAPEPPARWELVVRTLLRGHLDDTMWDPRDCRPAPDFREEARHQGLL